MKTAILRLQNIRDELRCDIRICKESHEAQEARTLASANHIRFLEAELQSIDEGLRKLAEA